MNNCEPSRRARAASESAISDHTGQPELDLLERDGPAPGAELAALIEALLLVAPGPSTIDELSRGAGVSPSEVRDAIDQLSRQCDRGWVIQTHGDEIQLATAPRFARSVRRFLKLDREARLSPAALETLAIVAYQQPVTRSEIEAIRGVDCASVLATLHDRGLIAAAGRLTTPGQPIQYVTTAEFLRHFGLSSLNELPELGHVGGRDARDALQAAVATARPTDESTG
jgi:segregation and condensation protein B